MGSVLWNNLVASLILGKLLNIAWFSKKFQQGKRHCMCLIY